MKKFLILIGIIFFLLAVGFTGCTENKDKNEKKVENSFIGTWSSNPYYIVGGERNDEPSSTAIIYENGTMRSESVYEDITMWNPYTLDDKYFCLGDIQNVTCYTYKFSENGSMITLYIKLQDPYTGEDVDFYVELIKK